MLEKHTKIIFVLLVSFLFVSFAFGNGIETSPQVMTTSKYENDVSVTILKTLFGGMPIFGQETDALKNVFKIFNFLVLVIGSILTSYTLALSFASTAQTGQLMGRFNSTMTPIRTALGVAFILPVANGYTLIQVAIMWLVMQGCLGANYIWSTFVSSDTLADSLAVAPIQPSAKQLAKNVLIASTCMAAVQKQADLDGDDITMGWSYGYGSDKEILKAGTLAELVKKYPGRNITLNAGNLTGSNGIPDNACGVITIKSFEQGTSFVDNGMNKNLAAGEAATIGTGLILGSNSDGIVGKVTGYGAAAYSAFRIASDFNNDKKDWDKWVAEMGMEHANATENLLFNAGKIANAIVDHVENKNANANKEAWSKDITYADGTVANNNENLPSDFGETMQLDQVAVPAGINTQTTNVELTKEQIKQEIDKLGGNYQQYFRKKAADTYQDGMMYETLVKNANKYGWMMAGAFFTQMGGMTDAVNQVALETPSSNYRPYTPDSIKNKYLNSRYFSELNYYFSNTETYGGDDSNRLNTVDKVNSENDGALSKFYDSGFNLSVLIENLLNSGLSSAISDQEHPIMQLKRLGSLMLAAAMTLLTYMSATMGNTDGNAAFLISMFGYTMILVLFTGGITMSYILPMLPVLMWLGMCFGWLVMVIQAMIAAQLWIVMHLTPHQGEDFIGNQRNGYQLVLTLVIRPILMTIGYIAAVLAITVVGYFINNLFVFIYQMSQVGRNGFATAMFSVVIVPLMYAAIIYIVLKEMLNIMHKVPDELLNWFGGNGQSLGGYARDLSGGSVQALGMMNNQIGRPFDAMKHNLAERANYLQNKQNGLNDINARAEAKRRDMENLIAGGSSGSINGDGFYEGGQANSSAMGIYGGSGLSSDNVQKWADLVDNGTLANNSADISKARNALYTHVPQENMDAAFTDTTNGIMAEKREAAAKNEPFVPVTNTEFVRRVNANLGKQLFGDNAPGMEHMAKVAEARTNSPAYANNLMKKTFKKIDTIAQRTGQDYKVVSQDVSRDIVSSMKGFADDKNTQLGSINPTTINKYGDGEMQKNYKIAGSMLNAWNKSLDSSGKNSSNDVLEYRRGEGFSFSDRNYDQRYDDGSWMKTDSQKDVNQ